MQMAQQKCTDPTTASIIHSDSVNFMSSSSACCRFLRCVSSAARVPVAADVGRRVAPGSVDKNKKNVWKSALGVGSKRSGGGGGIALSTGNNNIYRDIRCINRYYGPWRSKRRSGRFEGFDRAGRGVETMRPTEPYLLNRRTFETQLFLYCPRD